MQSILAVVAVLAGSFLLYCHQNEHVAHKQSNGTFDRQVTMVIISFLPPSLHYGEGAANLCGLRICTWRKKQMEIKQNISLNSSKREESVIISSCSPLLCSAYIFRVEGP